MLDVLMSLRREWCTQCVYCGQLVVNPRLMPSDYCPQSYGGLDKIKFTIHGHEHIALAATADHYFERHRGGHSDLNNILPACRPCNNARSWGCEIPRCIDCLTNPRTRKKRCEFCHWQAEIKRESHNQFQRLCSAVAKAAMQHSLDNRKLVVVCCLA